MNHRSPQIFGYIWTLWSGTVDTLLFFSNWLPVSPQYIFIGSDCSSRACPGSLRFPAGRDTHTDTHLFIHTHNEHYAHAKVTYKSPISVPFVRTGSNVWVHSPLKSSCLWCWLLKRRLVIVPLCLHSYLADGPPSFLFSNVCSRSGGGRVLTCVCAHVCVCPLCTESNRVLN